MFLPRKYLNLYFAYFKDKITTTIAFKQIVFSKAMILLAKLKAVLFKMMR